MVFLFAWLSSLGWYLLPAVLAPILLLLTFGLYRYWRNRRRRAPLPSKLGPKSPLASPKASRIVPMDGKPGNDDGKTLRFGPDKPRRPKSPNSRPGSASRRPNTAPSPLRPSTAPSPLAQDGSNSALSYGDDDMGLENTRVRFGGQPSDRPPDVMVITHGTGQLRIDTSDTSRGDAPLALLSPDSAMREAMSILHEHKASVDDGAVGGQVGTPQFFDLQSLAPRPPTAGKPQPTHSLLSEQGAGGWWPEDTFDYDRPSTSTGDRPPTPADRTPPTALASKPDDKPQSARQEDEEDNGGLLVLKEARVGLQDRVDPHARGVALPPISRPAQGGSRLPVLQTNDLPASARDKPMSPSAMGPDAVMPISARQRDSDTQSSAATPGLKSAWDAGENDAAPAREARSPTPSSARKQAEQQASARPVSPPRGISPSGRRPLSPASAAKRPSTPLIEGEAPQRPGTAMVMEDVDDEADRRRGAGRAVGRQAPAPVMEPPRSALEALQRQQGGPGPEEGTPEWLQELMEKRKARGTDARSRIDQFRSPTSRPGGNNNNKPQGLRAPTPQSPSEAAGAGGRAKSPAGGS